MEVDLEICLIYNRMNYICHVHKIHKNSKHYDTQLAMQLKFYWCLI